MSALNQSLDLFRALNSEVTARHKSLTSEKADAEMRLSFIADEAADVCAMLEKACQQMTAMARNQANDLAALIEVNAMRHKEQFEACTRDAQDRVTLYANRAMEHERQRIAAIDAQIVAIAGSAQVPPVDGEEQQQTEG